MKLFYFSVVLLSSCTIGNIVNNVRVVNHIGYVTEVITQTVLEVEKKGWWNLKVPAVSIEIDEVILGWHAKGTVTYKNGFVVSIQAVDLVTVNSNVDLNSANLAEVILKGTLRMHNVILGHDVQADLEDGTQHFTSIFVYPVINLIFTITKIIDHDEIAVAVDGSVQRNLNDPTFTPFNKTTDVLTTLFNRTMFDAGISAWGPDVFESIAADVISTKVTFPTLCYNCPA